MTAPVREGEILARKYRVEKVLGVGGMGVVVSAMHLQLDQRVALKFLLPDALAVPEVVARFAREARAAARIKSEHVARVIDVGELDSGSPFMVMEFLEGEDLAEVLASRGPLPISEIAPWILQACEALAEAHAAGIIHRDLKPSNLFLAKMPDKSQIIKVLDFGISKASGPVEGALTSTQALLGSPLYMSPEQMTAPKTIDPRSDIWSIGVILHQLLTDSTPFEADTMPELIAAIIANTPPPPSSLRTGIGPEVDAIVRRCLAKDRDARFANVAALAHALAPWAPEERQTVERISRVIGSGTVSMPKAPPSGANVTARIVPLPETGGVATSETIAQSAWGGTHVETRRERKSPLALVAGLGVAGLVVVGAVVGYAVTRPNDGPTAARAPAASLPAAEPSAAPSASATASETTPLAPAPSTPALVVSAPAASAPPVPKPVLAAKPAAPKPAPHPPKPEPAEPTSGETNKLKMEIK